jgi:peptidoglycan/LPS O-acetylase OafA/YrhL
MDGKFRYSLQNLRGVAIIFVMLSHLSSFYALGRIGELAYFFVGDSTTWFVFISGYIFYYMESDRFHYPGYVLKKVKYVVVPYLVMSVPAILIGFYLSRPALQGLAPLSYVEWSLLTGGSVIIPMWFIPMILIFFMLAPVFNHLAKSRLIYLLAAIGIGLSLFSTRPIGNANPGLSFVHFVGFYLLGIAFAVGAPNIDALKSKTRMIIIGLALAVFVAAAVLFERPGNESYGFYDGLGVLNLLQFGKLALLIAVFFLFEMFLNEKNTVLSYIAKISFGLFFIHGFYIAVFAKFSGYTNAVNPPVRLLVEIFAVVIVSVVTVFVLKRVLQRGSRFVIGC